MTQGESSSGNIIGAQLLSERPQQATKVMQVIGLDSEIDAEFTRIVCAFMTSDLEVAAAILDPKIPWNTREKMIRSAAEVALRDDSEAMELFKGVMKTVKDTKEIRNSFVHGLWALPEHPKESLSLVQLRSWAECLVGEEQALRDFRGLARELFNFRHLSEKSISTTYTDEDLEREVSRAAHSLALVRGLVAALAREDDPDRQKARKGLAELLNN